MIHCSSNLPAGSGTSPDVTYPQVSHATYKKLFKLADWLLHAAPWEKMSNRHCISIIDPDTGLAQIAAVMGNGGDIFGLHLYLPDEGTRWFSDMFFQGHTSQSAHNAQFDQRMIELAFDDGLDDLLDEHDDDLDERYAPEGWEEGVGPEQLLYALFRSYQPGCPPWHSNEQEAQKLLTALRLIKHYYEGPFQKHHSLLFSPDLNENIEKLEASLPTYELPKGADASDPSQWSFSIATYTSPESKPIPSAPSDEVFAARMTKHRIQQGATWEIGAIFLPSPVLDHGRPHYAVLAFVGDRANGMVHGITNALANGCRFQLIRNCLEKAASDCGHLPSEIVVGSPIAELALTEVSESCGITITPAHDPSEMSLFHEITSSLLESDMFAGSEAPLQEISEDDAVEMMKMLGNAPGPDASPAEMQNFIEKLGKNPKASQIFERFLEDHPELLGEDDDEALIEYTPPASRRRFVFRVDLTGAKPPIWRRITLPVDATFFDLHLAIQAAFGWSGYHLHGFDLGSPSSGQRILLDWNDDDDDFMLYGEEKRHELDVRLKDLFGQFYKSARYTYDFGDSWNHRIKLEKEIDDTSTTPVTAFDVIKGKGAHPIEDCGGIWGLQTFIDGTHPDCKDLPPERLLDIQNGTFHLDEIYPRDPGEEISLLDEMNHY